MKRLLQALSKKIYEGDIIIDNVHNVPWRRSMHVVDKVAGKFVSFYIGANVCNTTPAIYVTKLKIETFRNEWNKLFNKNVIHEAEKLTPLEQLCVDKGVHYLYEELTRSRTREEFITNSNIINSMLTEDGNRK